MSHLRVALLFVFFFFNDTATTEIYTLSLHDALPIFRLDHSRPRRRLRVLHELFDRVVGKAASPQVPQPKRVGFGFEGVRSEEHTSELQSRQYLVCRLLLEKKQYSREATRRSTATPQP